MKKVVLFAFGLLAFCSAVWASIALVDLTVDPPEIVYSDGRVGTAEIIDDELSIFDPGQEDTLFEFIWAGDGELSYDELRWEACACGILIEYGNGPIVPLSELDGVDELRFFSSDQEFAWDRLRSIRCRQVDSSLSKGDKSLKASRAQRMVSPLNENEGDDSSSGIQVGEMIYEITIENPSPEDFKLFDVEAPGDTIRRDGLPECSGGGPYYSNVVSVVAKGGVFVPPSNGRCIISCASDDDGYLKVGETSVNSSLSRPGSKSFYVIEGQPYAVEAGFNSVGGPYFFTPSINFIPDVNKSMPRLEVSPETIRFSLKQGSSVTDAKSHDVRIVGETGTNQYTIACAEAPSGVKTEGGRFFLNPNDTEYWEGLEGTNTIAVTYRLLQNGTSIDEKSAYFVVDKEKEEKCDCECNEGSEANSGSVEFSQRFGRTPWIKGLPSGSLQIHETTPTARLGTPGVLHYNHPMMRRVISRRGMDAVIVDDSGDCTEYKDGFPIGVSAGSDGLICTNSQGRLVEVLSDRTRLTYNALGAVESITPPDGSPVAVKDLGIEIERDNQGYLTRITSRSDGEMLLTRESANAWTLTWTSPSGAFIKSFSFNLENNNRTFSLYEYRNEDFNFRYRWTYVDEAKDWTFEKGPGDAIVTREEKVVEWNSTNGVWEVNRRFVDAQGVCTVSERSVLDTERGIGKTLDRRINGQALYTAERDEETGLITNECRIGSSPHTYRYDEFGRLLESSTVEQGQEKKVTYAYSGRDNEGFLDRRPTNTVERIGGVVVSETSNIYTTNLAVTVRSSCGSQRTSLIEFDEFGRRTLSVTEGGRASRTLYSELGDDYSWTETTEEGVWKESTGFELVDGKSTKVCNEFNQSGNMLRQLKYALIDGNWHETGWTTNRYNATHKIVYSEHSDGRSSAAEWICTGSVWERDESGIVISNRYDGAKRKIASTRHSPLGAVTTSYVYDAAGRIVRELTTADGCETDTVERTYDERGRVVRVMDNGQVTTTSYSDDDLITTITYADGGTRVTTRNQDGSLASITGTAVTPEYYTYGVTADGLEWTCVHYGRAASPRYEKTYRNGFGETVRIERGGFGGATLVTENTYDEKGRLVSTSETGKPTVTYEYDDWGDLISTTQTADGVTRTTESDSEYVFLDGEVWRGSARRLTTSDATIAPLVTESYSKVSGLSLDRIAESFTVDVRGNTNRTWSAMSPDEAKRTSWTRQAGVDNVAFSESIDGAMVMSVDVGAVTNLVSYDAFKRQIASTDGRGNTTTYAYDGLGRLSRQIDPCGNETAYAYDTMGRITAVTNALGGVTSYAYDLRGNKTYEGGATYPVSYEYDVYGNRTSMTTYRDETGSEGDTTSWVYDEATGLVTQKLYANGIGPCYNYTNDGKLATRTWARGVVTSYGYDGWGNLTSTTYSDGTPSVMFAYDAIGRQKTASDAAGTTTYSYDDYGDEARVAMSGLYSKTLIRHRDAYGRDLGHTMDGSRKNIIEYDTATGRIHREQLGGAWYTWNYLPGTHLKSSLSVGTAGQTTWSYEPNRDLLTQVKNTAFGSVISQYDYANDALGRRTVISRSGTMMSEQRSDEYGYNARSELISAAKNGTEEYAYQYDDIGNRESSVEPENEYAYTANELNQYTDISSVHLHLDSSPSFTPQYDFDGNQTLVKTKTGIWSVTYNGENRPVLWACGTTNIVMKFDRMGRRVEYIEREGETTLKHQEFVYDGYLCVQRLNGTNNAITDLFEWDPTEPVATRPLFWQARTSEGNYSLFYTHDGNKNVSEAVFYQRARGVAAHYEYAPFGEVITQTRGNAWGSLDLSILNPWRFSSEYADDTLGLVYYNYRHYEPLIGRWLCRDPIGEDASCNLIAFCGNRTYRIDNLGLEVWSVRDTGSCDSDDVDKKAAEILALAVAMMEKEPDENKRHEFYGAICCKCGELMTTGPFEGVVIPRNGSTAGGIPYEEEQPASPIKGDPRVACPKGFRTVGYYHTHPWGEDFSDMDKDMIKAGVQSSYMSVNGTTIHRLDPYRTDDPVEAGLPSKNIKIESYPAKPRQAY